MAGYSRVLLKLSGEAFSGPEGALSPSSIEWIAEGVAQVAGRGVQVGVVTGGGNILRGGVFSEKGTGRAAADQMGMLATVINSLALQDALELLGQDVRVLSAVEMNQVCEPFILRRAVRHLQKGRVVILAGGTGNPFFTTDTAAALRAAEIGAQVLLKGTKVDGIYSADPKKHPGAKRWEKLTYGEVLAKRLEIMDLTAITLCQERELPVIVFDMFKEGNLLKVVEGEPVGTLVTLDSDSEKGER